MSDIRSISPAAAPRTDRTAEAGRAGMLGLRPVERGRVDQAGADTARQLTRQPATLAQIAHEALGSPELPARIDLIAALEAARDFAPLADRAVPGLGRLVAAVIDDESRKLTRSLDLAGQ